MADKFEKRLIEETGKLDKRIMEETGILRNDISKSRADIIKWMFVFIFGQFWAITGVLFSILFVFFRK